MRLCASFRLGSAEIVRLARFGPDAINIVFRANGRVSERLLRRGEEAGFELVDPVGPDSFDVTARNAGPLSNKSVSLEYDVITPRSAR